VEQSILESTAKAQELIVRLGYETLGARIRRQRLNQGISVRDLAEKAQVNKNSILRLEKGLGSHPLTLVSVCQALSLHMDGLALADEVDGLIASVHRVDQDTWHDLRNVASGPLGPTLSPDQIPIQLLTSRLPNGRVVPTIILVNQRTPVSSHHGEEFVYVLEGNLKVTVADKSFTLSASESINFWSGEQHCYEPFECEETKILSVRVDY
jgi:transcriptional regulator with XRE-family HTH domain